MQLRHLRMQALGRAQALVEIRPQIGDPLVEQAAHARHLPIDLRPQPELVERGGAGRAGDDQQDAKQQGKGRPVTSRRSPAPGRRGDRCRRVRDGGGRRADGRVGQLDQPLDLRLELGDPLLVVVGAACRPLEPEQLRDVGAIVGEQAGVGAERSGERILDRREPQAAGPAGIAQNPIAKVLPRVGPGRIHRCLRRAGPRPAHTKPQSSL